ncbi:MAG TPA: TetR/AcrR family transcriptional regulator [Gaiella sp.]|jgi:AcrR family transcriptional regulator|nr:TetR/AcrR family transcriptional regulator [Gaiella sp.]
MAEKYKTYVLFCKVGCVPKLSAADKEARRARVLEGARRCFARYGYEGATVVRLEREIGLSRGAIFNWFSSKQELFLALAAEDNSRLLALFAEDGFDALLEAVTEHEPDWLAVYLEFGRRLKADAALRERWLEIAPPEARDRSRAWIERGQASGELRGDVSSDEIAQFLGVVIDGIVAQRALGFDPPPSAVLLRFVRDATTAAQAPESSLP